MSVLKHPLRLVLITGSTLIAFFAFQPLRGVPHALASSPRLYFSSPQTTLPPNQTVDIVLDAQTTRIVFAHIEFTFDQTKVQLADEIQPANSLTSVVGKTSLAQANTSGRVVITTALDPGSQNNPPTGVFSIASFVLASIAGGGNQTTELLFDDPKIQIVQLNTAVLPVTTVPTTLTLNPSGTAAVVPTPTPTVGLVPTNPLGSVTLKVRLQGITSHANSQSLRITLKQGNGVIKAYQHVPATADTAGVYSTSIPNTLTGTFDIFVKSPSHLQRKFPGVTLGPNVATLNLTGN